jgi:hypothetical protein
VLSGTFVDMLAGTVPMNAFGRRKVIFWFSADQILDLTTRTTSPVSWPSTTTRHAS